MRQHNQCYEDARADRQRGAGHTPQGCGQDYCGDHAEDEQGEHFGESY
jgi:hypothetical protein